jgi:hypothetical protein
MYYWQSGVHISLPRVLESSPYPLAFPTKQLFLLIKVIVNITKILSLYVANVFLFLIGKKSYFSTVTLVFTYIVCTMCI